MFESCTSPAYKTVVLFGKLNTCTIHITKNSMFWFASAMYEMKSFILMGITSLLTFQFIQILNKIKLSAYFLSNILPV